MKKTMFIFGIMLMFLFALSNATTAIDAPLMNVSLVKYEPLPAEPNSYVEVWIKVSNIGNVNAPNARLVLDPEFPFSIDKGQKSSEDIGVLRANYEKVIKFVVRVDKDAVQGTNDLDYEVTADYTKDEWLSGKVEIDVKTSDANLAVVEVKTDPEQIEPGKTAKLTIKLRNTADSPLKDVTVSLDFSTVRSSTTTLYDLPFAPLGTSSEQKIYKINPGDTRVFEFIIMAYPEAEANLYKIPLDITYNDDVGNEYTKEDMIGLVVNSEPELVVSVDDIEPNIVGQSGDLILRFVNRGLTDIKFLSVTIGESESYEVLSTSKEVYIGNIESDDYETVDYDIKLLKMGEMEIPVTVKFRDATNKVFEQSTNLKTDVKAQANGNGSKIGTVIFWIVLIVIIVLIVWWVKKRKKKKNL